MTVTDWLEITITFKDKCNECGKDVLPGKALWSRSAKAAKHLSCGKKSVIKYKLLVQWHKISWKLLLSLQNEILK
jgi:hypothetical protein